MLVESQQVEQTDSHRLSRRSLVRVLTGGALATTVGVLASPPDSQPPLDLNKTVSREGAFGRFSRRVASFFQPSTAKAAEPETGIPTWINRCGDGKAHSPVDPTQKLVDTRLSFEFVLPTDQGLHLETHKRNFSQTSREMVRKLNEFYRIRMGVNITWDGKEPNVVNLTRPLSDYQTDVTIFTTEVFSLPVTAQKEDGAHWIFVRMYGSVPSEGFDTIFPKPGAWSGSRGKYSLSAVPAVMFSPNLPQIDLNNTSPQIGTHDIAGHPFFGSKHSTNPFNVLFRAPNSNVTLDQIMIEAENLENTCPPGDKDPLTYPPDPKFKHNATLPIVVNNI